MPLVSAAGARLHWLLSRSEAGEAGSVRFLTADISEVRAEERE